MLCLGGRLRSACSARLTGGGKHPFFPVSPPLNWWVGGGSPGGGGPKTLRPRGAPRGGGAAGVWGGGEAPGGARAVRPPLPPPAKAAHAPAARGGRPGTQDGGLFGSARRGRRVRIGGATFPRLGADGLVVEDVHFTDMAGLLAQLGLA